MRRTQGGEAATKEGKMAFTTKDTARQSRNQNEKSRIHHEGTKDTKVSVGCASRTGRSRNISRKERKGRKEKKLFSELGGLARAISESESARLPENLRRLRNFFA